MNRFRSNTILVLLACFVLVFAGCSLFEGPAGEDGKDGVDGVAGADGTDGTDGADGTDGVDGNVTCLVCHSDENLAMKQHEFARSSHFLGEVDAGRASWSGSCVQCHTSDGFIEFATTGTTSGGLTGGKNSFECKTCHDLHTTFEYEDYALRLTEAESIWDDGSFLLKGTSMFQIEGNSNLCANCHQSRRAEPAITNPGTTFNITSTHYGPHHGAQANVLAGVGMAEIAGTFGYDAPYDHPHADVGCVGCHMDDGDHSFVPSIDACVVCHSSATDFDYHGVQTEIEELLDELRDILIAKGVVEEGIEELFELNEETGEIELVEHSEGYHPVVGEHAMDLARAFFNWVGLLEDRSFGIHNPVYFKALLENSIAAANAL